MKKSWIVACVLLFVAIAGFAETPSTPPLTPAALAAILGQPAASCAPQQQQSPVLLAAKRPKPKGWEKSLCTATANCETGTISCSGNNSTASCTAVDRNCSIGEQGHVTCDGVTTVCPTVCVAPCSTGTVLEKACCQCNLTGDCFNCCRCEGGIRCAIQCNS